MASEPLTVEGLSALLVSTGHHHHQAYISADGADPEWALWYAGYMQAEIWDRAGAIPTRSKLVHLLLAAEETFITADTADDWPDFYAAQMLPHLAG